MKTLFTGCYGHMKHFAGRPLVRISWGAPRVKGLGLIPMTTLAWANFKAWKAGAFIGDALERRADYIKQLDELRASGQLQRIIEALPDNAVLLCWEGDPNDCHRSWLSDYLTQHGLADIKEFPH